MSARALLGTEDSLQTTGGYAKKRRTLPVHGRLSFHATHIPEGDATSYAADSRFEGCIVLIDNPLGLWSGFRTVGNDGAGAEGQVGQEGFPLGSKFPQRLVEIDIAKVSGAIDLDAFDGGAASIAVGAFRIRGEGDGCNGEPCFIR